jgi:hypothetical protein
MLTDTEEIGNLTLSILTPPVNVSSPIEIL